MSETVDTRVVEARFDSKQFEQGVDKTVKKLDELKKSLNLESTGKSVAEIGNKVEEATNKASNSLEKLQDRFTSFTGMLKQKLLSGIADEIVGVFFKIKSSFESLVTSMSTAQIGVGMQRYTDILTSVRTLVSAGVNQDKAYTAIERLGQYADQTSYSLDSMVSTMSKFKTAGADIDTAARMIEGLSNAAASMGVNAQQAERAYLNLQQAYSKKVMLQNDWISFESIPMVGEKFNQAIIDAAVKVGTLKESKGKAKIDPKVQAELEKKLKDQIISQDEYNAELEKLRNAKTYETVKKSGAKIRSAKGITASNMSANLASRWFTDEVMEEVFGNTYFFGEVGIRELNAIKQTEKRLKEQFGTDEEGFNEAFQKELDKTAQNRRIEKIKELDDALAEGTITSREYHEQLEIFDKSNVLTVFGYNCLRAGQEARSFTDVLNTLKDAISRGWATSFELIFGRLDEAADFFTKLTESNFANAIYAIGEFRNAVLESWSGSGGRDNMLGVLEYMDEITGSIFEKLGLIRDSERYFNEHFDEQYYNGLLNAHEYEDAEAYRESIQKEADASPFEKVADELGQRLAILGRDIRDFFEKVHDWFTEADSTGVSRLQRISNVLSAFGAVANGAFTAAGMGLEFIGKIYNSFKTSFDKLWEVMDKLANKFSSYFDPNKAKEGIDIFQILSDTFDNVLTVVSKLNGPLTTLIGVLGDVAEFFLDIGVGTFLTNIQFFTDVFAALLELIGLGSAQQERKEGVIEGIGKEIQNLGTACKDAFQAASDFFTGLFDDLRKLLGIGNQVDGEEGGFFKNIENLFNTNKFIQNIKGWIDQAIKDIGSVDFWGRTFKSLFYTEETKYNGSMLETKWVEKPLTAWVLQAVEDIKAWFADLPNKISGIGISIGDFFKSIFYYKTSVANSGTVWVKKDFTRQIEKTFKDMLEAVKKWFKELPSKAKSLGITIGDFFKSIFYYKTSVANSGTVWVKKDFTRQIENVFKDIKDWLVKDFPMFLHSIFAGVSDFVTMVWNALTGNNQTAEADNAAKNAADQTQAALDNSFANVTADGILGKLQTVASNIWNGILTIFTGNSDKSFNDNWLAEKVQSAIENIGSFAETAWNNTKEFIINLPSTIARLFDNSNEETKENGTVWSAISGFANRVATWISEIPNTVLEFWKNVEKQTGTIWDTIINWITGKESDAGRLTKAQQDTVKAIEQHGGINYAKAAEAAFKQQNWREDNPIFANLEDFFNNLKDYFIDKITHLPENIANGLANGAKVFESLIETATGWINEDIGKENLVEVDLNTSDENGKNSSLLESLETFGKTIWSLITETIPKFIGAGFEWIKVHAESWAEAIKGLFSGGEKTAEEEANSFGDKIKSILEKVFKHDTFDKKIYDAIYSAHGKSAAESYKEQTANPIVQFFKGIVDTAGNILSELGPKVVDGINKAFNWISDGLTNATKFLSDAVESGHSITEIIEDKVDPEKNAETSKWAPLWEAVKNVGKTLKHIILEVIPNFIISAASYIGQHVGEWLSPIFGGGSSESSNSDDSTNKETEFIKSLIDDHYQELMHSGQIEEAEHYLQQKKEEYSKKVADKIGQTTGAGLLEVSSFWNEETGLFDYESYAKSLGMIFDPNKSSSLFGALADSAEVAKDGEKNAVSLGDSIGNIFGSLSDLVNSAGKNPVIILGLVATVVLALSDLVDNVMFLDDAIGWNFKWVGIGAMMTAISGIIAWCVYLASTGDETRLNAVYSVFDKVIEIFGKLGDLLKILAGVKAGTALFNMLESFFNWRSNKALQAASTASNGGSLLGGFLNKLLLIIGISEGTEILSTGLENTIKNFAQTFTSLAQGTGHLIQAVTDLVSVADKIDPAKESIRKIGELFQELREMFTYKELSGDYLESDSKKLADDVGIIDGTEYKGTYFFDKSGIEWFLSEALEVPVKAEEVRGKAKKAEYVTKSIADEVLRIMQLFTRLSGVIAEFKNAISMQKGTVTVTEDIRSLLGMTDLMSQFAEFAETGDTFANFKEALSSLGAAISLYSLGNLSGITLDDSTISTVVSLLSQLFGNKELQGLVSTLVDAALPSGSETMEKAERMVIFAGALASIAKACAELNEDSGANIEKLFTTVSSIPTSKAGSDKIDELSIQFGELGNAIGTFAISTSDLKTTNIKNAQTALDMLLQLAIGLRDIPNDSVLAKTFTGDKTLENFGLGIEALGENLRKFFESIENIDKASGQSVSYNRSNLQMAILAVQGIAEAVYIIAKAPHINAFDKTAQGGLFNYLGDLEKLAQGIMKFITEVNKYTDVSTYGVINYDFIFNAIDAIGKIAASVDKIPNKYDAKDMGGRIDTLGKILFGVSENGELKHQGFLNQLNEFLGKVVGLSKQGEYEIKLSEAAAVVQGYSDMVYDIMNILLKVGDIKFGDLVAEYYNSSSPAADLEKKQNSIFDVLLPSFEGINSNFDTYTEFLNNAASFNKNGIDNAVQFFSGLSNLADALYTFSLKDEKTGEYNTTAGLTKLMEFNWEAFKTVIGDMNNTFSSEGFEVSPKITPVLEISDDFKAKAEEMRKALGITLGENGEWISPNVNINITGIEIPQLADINLKLADIETAIGKLENTADKFNDSLSQVGFRIDINGRTLVEAIGPEMDNFLGQEGVVYLRGLFGSGTIS